MINWIKNLFKKECRDNPTYIVGNFINLADYPYGIPQMISIGFYPKRQIQNYIGYRKINSWMKSGTDLQVVIL